MQLTLFWIFASLMLLFGLGVIVFRNPVSSAMSLVMSFIALASLFILLDAYFIGIVQVLVYAGAVMVLFLFIIMLLDLKAETRREVKISVFLGGGVVLVALVNLLLRTVKSLPAAGTEFPAFAFPVESDAKEIGMTLFQQYNLPLQILGVLLLVATVGVVLLSRRELK
ncbi:MAG: NADH-quinone oxidoreductase subunit J [Chthoniobacterales bacterium]